ncbi:MAG TPA: PilZ domain-containing protein [Polyangia bacterium]|jgi:hypothetical protein
MPRRGGPERDRRLHPRAITNLLAELTVGERSHPARVINLSLGGALLDLGATPLEPPVALGAAVTVAIRYRGRSQPVRVEARAVHWNSAIGPVPLLAVQFAELDEESTEVLEELLWQAMAQLRGRALAAP